MNPPTGFLWSWPQRASSRNLRPTLLPIPVYPTRRRLRVGKSQQICVINSVESGQYNNALTPARTTNGQSFRQYRRGKAHGIKWGGECGACFELRRAYHLFVGQRIHQSEGEEGGPIIWLLSAFWTRRMRSKALCERTQT